MAESLTETRRGTARTARLDRWNLAASTAEDHLPPGASHLRATIRRRLARMACWLIAAAIGGALIYLCLCHWLLAVLVAALLLGTLVSVCLIDDYAPKDYESHMLP